MKILFLPQNYFPSVSGVPVVVRYLAEGLYKKGHEVAVATCLQQGTSKHEVIAGVHVYRFKMWKDFWHIYRGDTEAYINFVMNFKADATILECTQCITTDLLLPHLSEINGAKFFHIHGISGLSSGNKKFWALGGDLKHTLGHYYNWFSSKYYFAHTMKKAMPQFNATMCLSEIDDGIDYIQRYSRNNYILDNAADNMFFDEQFSNQQTLSKYAQLENPHFMMSCANYSYIKNQKEIIRQYYLSEASKDTSLVCIGSCRNAYYDECTQVVKNMESQIGHRDVHLLFGVNRIDIPGIINKASIYLVGSILEQYSISIIEAMSQGVPFVSSNVGNARLLPGGVTIDNISDMHDEIDRLMGDEAYRRSYSEAGLKFAHERCRQSVATDKLERIIKESL